ncbi:IS21 family transposase [Brevibacillus thermoruber]|uniref:IS21 family transposase n=1 Tax=Brevibacillus thermoruber TaxID=33942 RepID=A0A9X3TV14_9BACL|nr:IS21 family transposase [Brevibacillus thermoruber]MDA5111117.1 IS21 family transposase [Brevibacillus thermoruber]
MLRSGIVISLHTMRAEGKSIREIARETGHSRNTIRRYLRANGLPERKPRKTRVSKLDPFKPFLQERIQEGIYNCEVLYQLLREKGYNGGRTILKDYVKDFRPPKQIPAVLRYETQPGEYAQVDWGLCVYVDKDGNVRKVPVFVMVLGYSRATYIEFTKRCDIHSFLRCLIHAFEYFGGIPKVMLTDQMKTVVLGMGDDRKPRWHSLFADFAAAIGLVPKVCRVRRPETKGKVERGVRYVKNNFIPGRQFIDLQDLNRQALQWCDQINQRIHGTTGERPCDRLRQETLSPIPSADRWEKYLHEPRQVSRDGFVSYDGVRYGVPWVYSGREVTIREVNGWVEIWADGARIAHHEKVYKSRGIVFCPNQYAGLTTSQGYAYPRPQAKQMPAQQVEVRPLDVYEQVAEVGA